MDPHPHATKNCSEHSFPMVILLVLVFYISPRKCDVCPRRVGQISFLSAVHMHYFPRMKKVLIKSQDFLKCSCCYISDGWVKKTVLPKNTNARWDFLYKCECFWLSRKYITFERVSFSPRNIRYNFGKLVTDQFWVVVRGPHNANFSCQAKLCLFSSSFCWIKTLYIP